MDATATETWSWFRLAQEVGVLQKAQVSIGLQKRKQKRLPGILWCPHFQWCLTRYFYILVVPQLNAL
jgi:hypothetical protein